MPRRRIPGEPRPRWGVTHSTASVGLLHYRSWHAREITEIHTKVWREDLKEGGCFKADADCSIYSVSHLSCPWAWPLLRDVPADAGFLCDKARGHGKKDTTTTNGCYKNRMEECGLDSSDSGLGSMARYSKHGNEPHTRMAGNFLTSQATTGFSSGTPYQRVRQFPTDWCLRWR